MLNIVITDGDTVTKGDLSLDIFKKLGNLSVYGLTSQEEFPQRVKDADVILCNKTPLNRENLPFAPNLKYIGLFATGCNNVDLEYTNANGITVSNSPQYSTYSVAQHTFALILSIYSRVHNYAGSVNKGDWINSKTFSYFPFPIHELYNKSIGIIGFGAIGQQVYQVARSFGMNVLIHTRTKKEGFCAEFLDFQELLSLSDIVTIHCPLTPETKLLMDRKAFSKMKKNSVFINTARGPIVDENALKEALNCGKLLGAGLDVLTIEPMSIDCPLYGVENCIITPHIAWAGLETRKRLIDLQYNNLQSYIKGKPLNIVY